MSAQGEWSARRWSLEREAKAKLGGGGRGNQRARLEGDRQIRAPGASQSQALPCKGPPAGVVSCTRSPAGTALLALFLEGFNIFFLIVRIMHIDYRKIRNDNTIKKKGKNNVKAHHYVLNLKQQGNISPFTLSQYHLVHLVNTFLLSRLVGARHRDKGPCLGDLTF